MHVHNAPRGVTLGLRAGHLSAAAEARLSPDFLRRSRCVGAAWARPKRRGASSTRERVAAAWGRINYRN